jgi:hypothetical protein
MALRTAVDVCNRALQELGTEPITSLAGTDQRSIACNRIFNRVRDELLIDHPWGFSIVRRYVTRNSNSRFSLLHEDGGWISSGTGTGNYYLPASNVKSFKGMPDDVYEDDSAMTLNESLGSGLAAGEWGWGDNDSLGYPTIYVRLSDDTDPDTKYAADNDYLEANYDAPVYEFSYAYPVGADCLYVINLGDNSNTSVTLETLERAYKLGEAEWEFERFRIITNETEFYYRFVAQVTNVHDFDPLFERALALKLAEELAISLLNNEAKKEDMTKKFDFAINRAKTMNAIVSNYRREKDLSSHRTDTPLQRRGR